MKKILIGISLMTLATLSFASYSTNSSTSSSSKSNMNTHWTCTTNASSANTDADKAADNKMAQNKTSAMHAFSFASQHCRDCTKITCEASQ